MLFLAGAVHGSSSPLSDGHLGGDSVNSRRTVSYLPRYLVLGTPKIRSAAVIRPTQLLMAFGRGEIWGQGLGNSGRNWSICAGGAHRFHLRHYWGRTGLYRWVLALLMVFFVAFARRRLAKGIGD